MSRITVLVGSTRKNGNTALLAKAFCKGAAAKHTVTVLSVADLHIIPCTGCNACYHSAGQRCCIQDDMTDVYAQLALSDVIILASPVYFYGLSARLKALIDRLHAPIRNTFPTKKLGLLLVGASDLPDLFDPILLQYRMTLRYFNLTSIGTVLVPGVTKPGDVLRTDALEQAYALGASI